MASMETKQSPRRYVFDEPAYYRIQVCGGPARSRVSRLGGMEIVAETIEQGSCLTTLFGELADQAALAGVLNQLYAMHLTVESVVRTRVDGNDASCGR